MFSNIVEGLLYIHDLNILHRDLKPENIYLNHINECIIGDFGLASGMKDIDSENGKMIAPIGSPRYMSPEVIESCNYSVKSDIWSLGCIVQELCDNRAAFDGKSQADLIKRINNERTNRIPSCYSDYLQDLIDRMLEKDAKKRYTTKEVKEYLNSHITNQLKATIRHDLPDNDKSNLVYFSVNF